MSTTIPEQQQYEIGEYQFLSKDGSKVLTGFAATTKRDPVKVPSSDLTHDQQRNILAQIPAGNGYRSGPAHHNDVDHDPKTSKHRMVARSVPDDWGHAYYTQPWYSAAIKNVGQQMKQSMHSSGRSAWSAYDSTVDPHVSNETNETKATKKTKAQNDEPIKVEPAKPSNPALKKYPLRDRVVIDAWTSYERKEKASRNSLLGVVNRFIYAKVKGLNFDFKRESANTADDYAQDATIRVWESIPEFEASLPARLSASPSLTSGELFLFWIKTVAKNAYTDGIDELSDLQRERQPLETRRDGDVYSGELGALAENPAIEAEGWTIPLPRVLVDCEEDPENERCSDQDYTKGWHAMSQLSRLPWLDETDRKIIDLMHWEWTEHVESHDNNEIDETTRQYLAPGAGVWVDRRRTYSQEQIAKRLGISVQTVKYRLNKAREMWQTYGTDFDRYHRDLKQRRGRPQKRSAK